jgi:hypothetical protein
MATIRESVARACCTCWCMHWRDRHCVTLLRPCCPQRSRFIQWQLAWAVMEKQTTPCELVSKRFMAEGEDHSSLEPHSRRRGAHSNMQLGAGRSSLLMVVRGPARIANARWTFLNKICPVPHSSSVGAISPCACCHVHVQPRDSTDCQSTHHHQHAVQENSHGVAISCIATKRTHALHTARTVKSSQVKSIKVR